MHNQSKQTHMQMIIGGWIRKLQQGALINSSRQMHRYIRKPSGLDIQFWMCEGKVHSPSNMFWILFLWTSAPHLLVCCSLCRNHGTIHWSTTLFCHVPCACMWRTASRWNGDCMVVRISPTPRSWPSRGGRLGLQLVSLETLVWLRWQNLVPLLL